MRKRRVREVAQDHLALVNVEPFSARLRARPGQPAASDEDDRSDAAKRFARHLSRESYPNAGKSLKLQLGLRLHSAYSPLPLQAAMVTLTDFGGLTTLVGGNLCSQGYLS